MIMAFKKGLSRNHGGLHRFLHNAGYFGYFFRWKTWPLEAGVRFYEARIARKHHRPSKMIQNPPGN